MKVTINEFIQMQKHVVDMSFCMCDHRDSVEFEYRQLYERVSIYLYYQLNSGATKEKILYAAKHPFFNFIKSLGR